MNWIDINAAPPPDGTPVLVLAKDGSQSVAEWSKKYHFWHADYINSYEWDFVWEDSDATWRGVTHWMPLPFPPT